MTTKDESARTRIRESLDESLFVEAGAGTGKTRLLVNRIVNLIAKDKARIDEIAAITFTEDAASELKERVRGQLEGMLGGSLEPGQEARLRAALEGLEYAAIQTIHGFARSLLAEKPLEAGLPPLFETLDAAQAKIRSDERWDEWIRSALDRPEFLELWRRATGLDPKINLWNLRKTADGMRGKYHLLQGSFTECPPQGQPSGDSPLLRAADTLLAKEATWRKIVHGCNDTADKMYQRMTGDVFPFIEELRQADGSPEEVEWVLAGAPNFSTGRLGRQAGWPKGALATLREELGAAFAEIQALLTSARTALVTQLSAELERMALDDVDSRRSEAVAEFDDLLVWARDLLRDHAGVRRHFQRRYRWLLVDEFQDTDPLQIEIVKLLTCRGPDDRPGPGTIFIVGDPKQSIYGFRRADLRAYLRFKQWFQTMAGPEPLGLTANFRSHPKIIAWLNQVLGKVVECGNRFQADWKGLEASLVESDWPEGAGGHRVLVLGGQATDDSDIETLRVEEAETVAKLALEFGAGRYLIREDKCKIRRSEFRDLTILRRSRTGYQILERALTAAGVPYIVQGDSAVFATQEFRDLTNCLTAINDPTDQVAVVGALRSPAFGCSDVELWKWAKDGGTFAYTEDISLTPANGSVAESLLQLRKYHRMRDTASVPELVERFVRCRQLREIAELTPRSPEKLRRIDLFIELARSFQEPGGVSPGEFVEWLTRQREEQETMIEAAPSAVDENAVRMMTVHAAKGLEFPAVVLAGLGGGSGNRTENVIFDSDPEAAVKLAVKAGDSMTGGFDEMRETEKLSDEAEEDRLLYVAATRARDYLFPCLYRKRNDRKSHAAVISGHLESAMGLWEQYQPQGAPPRPAEKPTPTIPAKTQEDMDKWNEERKVVLAAAARTSSVIATALKEPGRPDPPPKERPEEDDSGIQARGRAATDVGRAVHAALQDIGPAGSPDCAEVCKRQADAHGLTGRHHEEVTALVEATLKTGAVREAARSARYWREAHVAAPLDAGGTLEGIIDLVFETGTGELVIADYKTDRTRGRSLEEMAAPYVAQLGAYAAAVEKTTPARVSRAVLVFSRPALDGQPAEYEIPDLEQAKKQALDLAEEHLAPA